MKEWTRTPVTVACGNCDQLVSVGDPVLVLTMVNLRRKLIRCPQCAGDAPPNLPPLETRPEPQSHTKRMKPLATLARRPEWTPYRETD